MKMIGAFLVIAASTMAGWLYSTLFEKKVASVERFGPVFSVVGDGGWVWERAVGGGIYAGLAPGCRRRCMCSFRVLPRS